MCTLISGWIQADLHATSNWCLVAQPSPVSLALAIIMSQGCLPNNSNMFLWHVLPSGKDQKCIAACTCLSKTINSANGQNLQPTLTESQTLHEQCKTVREYSFYESTIYIIYVWLRTCSQFTASCFSSGVSVEDRKTDTKGSFSCRSAAECRRVCNTERSPQLSCLLSPAQTVFKDQQ